MPLLWRSEALDQPIDPETGVFSVRLTAAAMHSINIYCEQPYTSPDGRRIAIIRSNQPDPRFSPPYELLVADVYTYASMSVEKHVTCLFLGTAAWSGWIYYVTADKELVRFNLSTLQKQVMWTRWPLPPDMMLDTVSADHRYLIGMNRRPDFKSELIRVDLHKPTAKRIYESEESLSHVQCTPTPPAPSNKHDVLVQVNRRVAHNHMWESRPRDNPHGGATHFIIDEDGGNFRPLAIGEPVSNSSAGHAAWIGDTGNVCVATHWDFDTWQLDPRWPRGNLFVVGPGMTSPRVLETPEHRLNHVSVSRCGKYFVCDSYPKKSPAAPIAIVVGNLQTGKYRTLLSNCGASGGGAPCGQPNPYFTADNKHVIYNADPHWLGQVFAATVPFGFLASLD